MDQPSRNLVIGILAPVDAGKTTLAESILYNCKSIRKWGRVDNKDAFLDTYELEKSRELRSSPSRRSLTWENAM